MIGVKQSTPEINLTGYLARVMPNNFYYIFQIVKKYESTKSQKLGSTKSG